MKKIVCAAILATCVLTACKSDDNSVSISSSLSIDQTTETSGNVDVKDNEEENNSSVTSTDDYAEPAPFSEMKIIPDRSELSDALANIMYENGEFSFIYTVLKDGEEYSAKSIETIETCCYTNCVTTEDDGIVDPLPKSTVYWDKYAVTDLDNDGVNELIYELSSGANALYLIFHEENNKVTAYPLVYRAMLKLSDDGRIIASSGASDTLIYRITGFDEDGFAAEEILSITDDSNILSGEKVDAETAENYCTQFWESPETGWKEPQ